MTGRADGTEPVADGTKPAADGTEPAADGTDPAADGTEPAADGTEPAADGTEPAAVGTEPVAAHKAPAVLIEGRERGGRLPWLGPSACWVTSSLRSRALGGGHVIVLDTHAGGWFAGDEAVLATELPLHGDPADRIIVATAQLSGAQLVTKDGQIRQSGLVSSIW